MKRSRKTLFALLLALVMTLGLAATAWATDGGVIVEIPGGLPGVNQPTPEVPEAYKIPFTKVVEQAGAFAPGPMRFSLEAFLPDENGGADRSLHTFSFDTSGTGIGSFSSEMTIPANVLGNSEGFYVREVNGGASGWTYSEDMYYAFFSIDASDGNNVRTLTLYPAHKADNGYVWERGNPVDRMSFTNSYTENLRTVEVPFTKTVKLGGNTAPGRTDFTLEIFDFGNDNTEEYKDVTYTAAVTTRGVGSYDGKLIISGPEYQVQQCISEGISVCEVDDGASGWTYSTAKWYIDFTPREDQDGKPMPFTIHPYDVQGAPVDKMTFENIYTHNRTTPAQRPTEKPNTPETTISSPKTFDAGVALYGVSALLSLSGTALIIKRKNG